VDGVSSTSSTTTGSLAAALDRPIVSTQWLADHLGSDGLVILDATVVSASRPDGRTTSLSGLDQYLVDGHVPGAVFADLLDVFSDPAGAYPFTRPDAVAFEAAAEAVGIDNETTVIVYDASVGQWASRIWWLFRAFGYDRVAVLDGGIAKWKAEGRSTELGHVQPQGGVHFAATERAELWVDKADVAAIVDGTASGTLICAVPPKEFSGEAGQRSRPGHIPGSLSAPAGRLVSRESNTYLSVGELHAVFADALESRDRIIVYCGAGIAAASDALALTLLGRADVALYDGSLNEWVADAETPLVTLAA
jgi:thiosulfate/3-mercaptopyruvate sulfurtransferase